MRRLQIILAFGLVIVAALAFAQSQNTFSIRLGWVPIRLSEQNLVGGEGAATATLSRSRLSITGSFEGLPAPAIAARLHRGAATGAAGPSIAELEVTHSTEGTLGGNVDLDRDQRAALLAGQLYIQLYADPGVPPDNAVLRGWLLGRQE